MLGYIITFFQVLFEELDKLLKPKPTAEQLEEKRRLNILYNFWRIILTPTSMPMINIVVNPLDCCKVCQVMYRECPLTSHIIYQRRKLPYKATCCPAHVRQITDKYK